MTVLQISEHLKILNLRPNLNGTRRSSDGLNAFRTSFRTAFLLTSRNTVWGQNSVCNKLTVCSISAFWSQNKIIEQMKRSELMNKKHPRIENSVGAGLKAAYNWSIWSVPTVISTVTVLLWLLLFVGFFCPHFLLASSKASEHLKFRLNFRLNFRLCNQNVCVTIRLFYRLCSGIRMVDRDSSPGQNASVCDSLSL